MTIPQALLGQLSLLSKGCFTILTHPAFKKYQVRINKDNFCDPRFNSYTGYIDIEVRHLFLYFFESRSNPAKDDVILWTKGDLNLDDMSKPCEGGLESTMFYPATRDITDYLSHSDVHSTFGVDPSITSKFTSYSEDVIHSFGVTQDMLHQVADYVAALLDRGVRVLIYVGNYDWACN
ncbi:hypothetical protein BJ165DRAFT_1529736 [Panaeolus papilionaceus]|nr:hypothetical protein BJ165DRAFT_1529736 [Panaeolus papilionaceus]